jgi:hypothetical protein
MTTVVSRNASVLPIGVAPPNNAINLSYTYSTVSDLKAAAAPPASGYTAKVLEYNDSPEYRYNTSSTRNDVLAVKPNSISIGNPGRWELQINPDYIHADWAGVKGSDATDTTQLNALGDAVYTVYGKGTIHLNPNKAYWIYRDTNYADGGIMLRAGINWELNNALLTTKSTCAIFGVNTRFGTRLNVTANVAAGATTLTLNATTGLSVGTDIFYRLGDLSYDSAEASQWGFSKVTAIAGNVITIDNVITQALAVPTINPENSAVYPYVEFIQDVTINGWNSSDSSNQEYAIFCRFARNITIGDMVVENPGAGVYFQYTDGARVNSIKCLKSYAQGGQASKGRVFGIGECRNIRFESIICKEIQNVLGFVEARSQNISIGNLLFQNNISYISGRRILFLTGQESNLRIDNCTVRGLGDFTFDSGGGTPGYVTVGNLSVDTDSIPYQLPMPGVRVTGLYREKVGGSTERVYDCSQVKESTFRMDVVGSGPDMFLAMPNGIILGLEIYTGSALTPAALNLSLGRSGNNGSRIDSQLSASNAVEIALFYGGVSGAYNNRTLIDNFAQLLLISPPAVTGLNTHLLIKARSLKYVGIPTAPINYQDLARTPTAPGATSGTTYRNPYPYPLSLYVPATYSPTGGAAATLAVALGVGASPATIFTESFPAASATGVVQTTMLTVPPGWYYKFTATNATIGTPVVTGVLG